MTLADGTESSITVDVSIRDDMPTLTVGEFSGAYGEGIDGTVNFDFGADKGEGAKIELSVNGGEKVAGVSTDGGKTWTFTVEGKTVTLNAETGEFHYDLPASGSDAEYSFQFTVTDADGDVVSAPEAVNVKVEGTDLSGMKGNVIGDDANVLTETAVSVTMPELPAGVTLVANQTVNVTDTDGTVYGQLIVDAEGNVTFKQTEAYSGGKHGTQGEELATGFSGSLNVTLADGTTSSITVDVSICDDMPIIEASAPSTSITPGGSGNNLVESDEVISFTEGNKGEDVRTTWWNGQVEISAAKVTYEGTDSLGHPSISEENPEGMSLGYSFYNGGAKQYYKNMPPQEDIDSGIAQRDNDGKWYREAPKSDWGLTVNGGEGDGEIQASDDNTSEAVVINLKGYAYGMTINFGAFFAGKSNPDDPAAGTGYDTVSEKALITFYKDGKLVYSTVVEGTNSGEFTFNTGDVVLEGFDKVVISAVDNGENSDFTIQGFDFITKRDDAIIVSKGEVKAESGADGFADAYMEVHAGFDLESIVTKANGNMGDDGTGTIEVQVNGETYIATLQVSTGSSSGESILTATLSGGSGTGSLNGQQLFTATLDKDGNWSMEQYEQFRVDNGTGDLSNEFELVFKTEDADGDTATDSVSVPLEMAEQTTNKSGAAIDNGDDTITITGGDGVAGTVAAGDSGGVTEGQQVEASYNVCFILDMSSSMDTKVGDKPWGWDNRQTRLDIAVESIQNFIHSIEGNTDFTNGSVTVAVIPFAQRAGNPIEITISRVDGVTSYSYGGDDNLSFAQLSTKLEQAIDSASVGSDSVTDYGPAFEAAADWFDGLGSSVENATGNITYFLTDGRPAGYGTDNAYQDDYQKAWEGYQKLLAAQGNGHIDIHAIGFGDDLSDTDMENLAMFDNTSQAEGDAHSANGWFDTDNGIYAPNGVEYHKPAFIDTDETYYVQLRDGHWQEVSYKNQGTEWRPNMQWGYYTEGKHGRWEWTQVSESQLYEQVITPAEGGTSQQVTDADSLTAAFESGFRPGALAAAGNDTITAEESASSVIVYGDVMNTDMLLNNLNGASSNIAAALVAADIDFGSGSKVFQWLEEHGNSDLLKGTDYEGWSHGDTVKYMLEHHEELGYETRVDGDGKPYLVDASGNVLNMDGTSAHVSLDELTGRTGGDDVITGSGADDFIFGQEGDDIISGGLGNDALYGGTGDDILFGDEDILSSVRDVLGISDDSDIIGAIKDTANDEDALTKFINAVEGAGNGGDDQLFGGSGDDLLFGMGGNDYLSGGEGEDFLFGGSGNDIIVYDENDYLVDGGSGIDFMVSDDNTLTLDDILSNKDTGTGPLVNSIEVLITGEKALDLTNINQLAEKYGITLGENADGKETLSLDMSKWTQEGDNTYTLKEGGLTLETNLERDMNGQDDAQIQQHMFILQNGQGS